MSNEYTTEPRKESTKYAALIKGLKDTGKHAIRTPTDEYRMYIQQYAHRIGRRKGWNIATKRIVFKDGMKGIEITATPLVPNAD